MEIQTFLLAESVTCEGHRHDVRRAALALIECTIMTEFPCRFTLPALALLRRESSSGDAPVSLRFNLIDEDGQPAGQPRQLLSQGVFPDGYRFYYLMAKLDFEFPSPGCYRLDITADEGMGGIYHYDIEIRLRD